MPMYTAIPHRVLFVSILLLCCTFGCTTTEKAKGSASKGPRGTKPYTIKGKTYYPLLSAHAFKEEGIASWYGPGFHGKQTANGERYDMLSMTAAHKLLPFETKLRVTNKQNGRSIVVRVNDRGPFVGDRVIDLTRSGAEQLGMLGTGTAPVVLESIGEVAGLQNGDLSGRFYVQIGAFGLKQNAESLVARLKSTGQNGRTYYAERINFWRVQAGPYPSLKQAEAAADALETSYPGAFVVAE